MDRRTLIKNIGAVICAGSVPAFLPRLIGSERLIERKESFEWMYEEIEPIIINPQEIQLVDIRIEYAHNFKPGTILYVADNGGLTDNPLKNSRYAFAVGKALPNNQVAINSSGWPAQLWMQEVVV